MAGTVKGDPPNQSGRSQARTRLARRAVVDAARALFLERGYQATTIDAVSDHSDVPAATVYRLFSSKLGILKALLDVSIAGDDQALSLPERPQVAALFAEADPEKLLAEFASITVAINARSCDVYRILSSASGSDPAAAATARRLPAKDGTTAKDGSHARLPAPAHCGPGYENATRQTSSMRSCPLSSTGCSSSTGTGRRSATNNGSDESSPTN